MHNTICWLVWKKTDTLTGTFYGTFSWEVFFDKLKKGLNTLNMRPFTMNSFNIQLEPNFKNLLG